MNIYIYGSNTFRNKVHKALDHGNVRFKIEDGVIEDIFSISRLKELIEENPTQTFIIDENNILPEGLMGKYLSFIFPKDSIKKSYLDKHGIGDVSVRKFDDLVIYIEKRIEAAELHKPKIKAEELTSIDEMFEHYE